MTDKTEFCPQCEYFVRQIEKWIADREAWKAKAERLANYTTHDQDCILSFWSAGRPTENGGYEACIKGKWYEQRPVDKTPKCECGLNEAFADYSASLHDTNVNEKEIK